MASNGSNQEAGKIFIWEATKNNKSLLMFSNTVMPGSQIFLFAGHLCARNREIFSAQIVLQPKIPAAVFH